MTLLAISKRAPAGERIAIEHEPGGRLSDSSLAVLNHIANAPQGAGFDALFAVFCQAKGRAQALTATRSNLHNVLVHFAARGRITSSGQQKQRLWRLNPDWRPAPAVRPMTAPPELQAPRRPSRLPTDYVGAVVPPRQFSTLHGPLYVPPTAQVTRAGSLDFKALASHGWRC